MCFWMVIFKGFHRYFVFFTITTKSAEKTGRFKKKFHEKIWTQTDFMMKFLNFFSKKKIENFSKFFFWKLFIRSQNVGKKKIFFEKNHDPNFGQNFDFYFCKGIVLFQKISIFFNFFSIFMTQRTVLVPSELDPALSPHYERA